MLPNSLVLDLSLLLVRANCVDGLRWLSEYWDPDDMDDAVQALLKATPHALEMTGAARRLAFVTAFGGLHLACLLHHVDMVTLLSLIHI